MGTILEFSQGGLARSLPNKKYYDIFHTNVNIKSSPAVVIVMERIIFWTLTVKGQSTKARQRGRVVDCRKKGALKSPAFYSNFDQFSINVALACETICLAGNQSREEAVKEREIFSVSEIL